MEKQSAVMEEEQLEERHLGIHGDADSRKEAQTIIEADENGINEASTNGVTQVQPPALCLQPACICLSSAGCFCVAAQSSSSSSMDTWR